MQSIDPLTLEKFSVAQNPQSPVNIRLNLRNITLTGLKDLVVSKVVLVDLLRLLGVHFTPEKYINCVYIPYSGFGADPKTSKFEVAGKTKRMTILGKYTLNGQVLILPITGNGLANLTFGLYKKRSNFDWKNWFKLNLVFVLFWFLCIRKC